MFSVMKAQGDSDSGRSLMSVNEQRLTELQARHRQTHFGVTQADETVGWGGWRGAGGEIGKEDEDERKEFGLDTTSSVHVRIFFSPSATLKICSPEKRNCCLLL